MLVLAVGGLGFGVFTASAFAQVLARVRPKAASSLSGLLLTAATRRVAGGWPLIESSP